MNIEQDDLMRLVFEVRRFLNKGDLMTRLATRARLYLEFPDMGTMHYAVMGVQRALAPSMVTVGSDEPITHVDEGTVEVEIGGMSILFTCKQRFMTQSGKAVGYASTIFETADDYYKRIERR